MSFAPDDAFTAAIELSPGPAPWYLSQPAGDLSSRKLGLTWEGDPEAGPSPLKDGRGRVFAAVSIYTYIWRISPTQFLVWRVDAPKAEGNNQQQRRNTGILRFALNDGLYI